MTTSGSGLSRGVDTVTRVRAAAERIRSVIEPTTPAVERLSYAQTSVSLRVAGTNEGMTLLFDRDPVEVLDGAHASEIELTLDARQLEQLARGRLPVQRLLLAGSVSYRGPVWKFLRILPILSAILIDRDADSASPVDGGVDRSSLGPDERSLEGMWAIECRGLHKRFGSNKVLDGVDLRIPEGLITIILGPSGTGKSVMLKHVLGLVKPDRGDLLVRGQPLQHLARADLMRMRRGFGVLFQDGALWGSMNIHDNVAFPRRQHTNLTQEKIDEIVAARLAEIGLSEAWDRMPAQLSGGMRKRAGLARAVVLDPEIVLFDEPDSGLDPVRTSLLCELIADIHGNHGGTYIVVTHDIKVLRTIGHYVAILFQGKIVANGFTDEILASKDPFVRQFLAGEAQGPLGMD